MSNTTVKITYTNGDTREFIASDELEKMINDGDMFSVTTFHSDMGIDIEYSASKMYAGNPIAAMGHMMMMKRNAETIRDEDDIEDVNMNIVIETLTSCIKFMSDEITSHQSNMSPIVDGHTLENLDDLKPELKDYQQEAIDAVKNTGSTHVTKLFKKGEPLVPDLKSVDVPTLGEKEDCPVINNHCDH